MEDDPEYDIAVVRVSDDAPDCEACLREAIETTLRRHHHASANISVVLVDDARMAQLNNNHLGHKGPTDVLTFDLRDIPGGADQPVHEISQRRTPVEGEVLVSVETAVREAKERGHSIEAELALYAVHGTLHLLGYDDHEEEAATRMHDLEDEILFAVGLGTVFRSNAP